MDLVLEPLSSSAEGSSELVTVRIVPDPARYEWRDQEGTSRLYDLFDGEFMPEDWMEILQGGMAGMPIDCTLPDLPESPEEYLEFRRPFVRAALDPDGPFPAVPASGCDRLPDTAKFFILSVDLVGSTQLSLRCDDATFARIVACFQTEMAELVRRFNGFIVNRTGDGLLACFPEGYGGRMSGDGTFDCSMMMAYLSNAVISPELLRRRQEGFSYRIGIDAGEAHTVSVQGTASKDLFGSTVNLAAKIQACAPSGAVLLGDTAYRLIHNTRRELCEPFLVPPEQTFRYPDGGTYCLHRIVGKTD